MQHSPEIKGQVLHIYDSMAKGDTVALENVYSRSDGGLFIGTDPNEWWASYDTFIAVLKAQMAEMGGGFPIVPGDLQAYSEGSIGWAADQPSLKLPDGSNLPFRLTAVFHREDGQWKVVQWHVSVGVSNEEALGTELTT